MSNPNDKGRQVGGDHYHTGAEYQHWDIIARYGLGYLEGCATKYLCRHPVKHKGEGHKDLLKAIHYVDKIIALTQEAALPYPALSGRPHHTVINDWLGRTVIADDDVYEAEKFATHILLGGWISVEELQKARGFILQALAKHYPEAINIG